MTPRVKKRVFGALRIAVCGVALWLVIRGVTFNDRIVLNSGEAELVGRVVDHGDPVVIRLTDGSARRVPREDIAVDENGEPQISYGLKAAWRNSRKTLLLLAFLIHFPVTFLQAIRLHWLLRAQNITIGYWKCVKFSFAGNFLNFATPFGSNAGDVFKAYFVTKHTEQKTEAVTTIVLDRVIGLGTLIVCVALITALSTSDSRLAQFRPYVLTLLGIGVVGVFTYFSATIRKYLTPSRWLSGLRIFTHLQRIDNTTRTLAAHIPTVAAAIMATVFLQVLAIGAYFTVAVALAMDAHIGNVVEYYAYFYTGAVIQALPGPPQGLGTVELAYRYFFAPFGTPSQIVCVAFLVRVVVLACSLPGLLITISGSYKPQRAVQPDEMRASPHNMETKPRLDRPCV